MLGFLQATRLENTDCLHSPRSLEYECSIIILVSLVEKKKVEIFLHSEASKREHAVTKLSNNHKIDTRMIFKQFMHCYLQK